MTLSFCSTLIIEDSMKPRMAVMSQGGVRMVRLLVFLLSAVGFSTAKDGKKTIMLIREFDNCHAVGKEDFAYKFVSPRIVFVGRGETGMSGTLNITSYCRSINTVKAVVRKCRSFSEPSTCEFFINVPLGDGCTWFNQKNQVWSNVLDKFVPQLKCPIHKGEYVLTNGTLDPDQFLKIVPNLQGFYYKIRLELHNKRDPLICMFIGLEFTIVRT